MTDLNRRSIRLKNDDYSQNGAYFLTLNIQDKQPLFGQIVNQEMILNDVGKMIDDEWSILINRFPNMWLDQYIIMADHLHGIIFLKNCPISKNAIGNIVGAFKSITTGKYIQGIKQYHWSKFSKRIWQRNYYEHVIRNETSLYKIREYIIANPKNWEGDEINENKFINKIWETTKSTHTE